MVKDINALIRKADREGLTPVVRLMSADGDMYHTCRRCKKTKRYDEFNNTTTGGGRWLAVDGLEKSNTCQTCDRARANTREKNWVDIRLPDGSTKRGVRKQKNDLRPWVEKRGGVVIREYKATEADQRELEATGSTLIPHPASPPVPKERAATTAEQDDYERKLAVIREQEAGNTKQLDDTPTTRELYAVINDGSHTNRIKPGVTRNFTVRKMMTGQTLDPDWKPRVVHRVWLRNITKAQATALEDKVFERMGNQGYTRVPHATTGNASEWLAWPHFSEDQAVKDAQRYMNAIAKEWNDVHTHSGLGSQQPTAGAD